MKIKPIFAWYDCWIGLFVDTAKKKLYVFPIPMFGIVIDYSKPPVPNPIRIPDILEVDRLKPPKFMFVDEPEMGSVQEYERWHKAVMASSHGFYLLRGRKHRQEEYISTLKHKPGEKVEVNLQGIGKVMATVDNYGELYYCVPWPEDAFKKINKP
jgi:hypothetical protein